MQIRKGNLKLLLSLIWVCLLSVLLIWQLIKDQRQEKRLALHTARAFFQQVVTTRRWNASHGGVYVPITSTTQPNKYLPALNRDLTTTNGLRLTKINPAYMTRQLAELAKKNKDGIQFHITSLRPIRPGNRATAWEKKWLESFEKGVKEQGEFIKDGKIAWFRYMAPLITKTECLQCHAKQGYKVGDIRGGLSVSLPFPRRTHMGLFVGYGSAAAIGLLFIFFGVNLYERKRLLFDATFDNVIPTAITDKNHTILMANRSYLNTFGSLPENRKNVKCYEHRPGRSCHTEQCPLNRIMSGARKYVAESIKEKEGVSRHFIVTAKPLLDQRGKVLGIVESFQDITERKQAEKVLEDLNRRLEILSITDGLTGIANRRHFDEMLVKEHARHARSGVELSLIMLDIDHFKLFNDSYGHVAGDDCLRQVGRVISDCLVRPADLAARYGGEEFACILPETRHSGALAIAEKIRQGIKALAIQHQGSKVAEHVTVSQGVLTVRCSVDGTAADLVRQVDELLYRAKSRGRNRVEAAATGGAGEKVGANLVQLNWQEAFCCGHQLIDAQHESLFQVANELLEAVLAARPVTEISLIITRLLDDVSQHFQDEEKILATVSYPGLRQHAVEHANLLAQGRKLAQDFQEGSLTVGEVFQFLANEVVRQHMLGADREFFPLIIGKGAAGPGVRQDSG